MSLDQGDNDPTVFWTYVAAALQRLQPGIGAHAHSLLQPSQPPPIEAFLATLINEITAVEEDITLILDDLHVIDFQPIHRALAFLLDHLPPRMHVVISSRADPPLPLARLRALGESAELRAADLRFTPDEVASFLNSVMGLNVSATDVTALETRTEGWIAGLQLAALSMQGRDDVSGFIGAFAGDDRYIVDYLVEEVLQRQTEGIRSFLLQTSILDRLSGPLCDAVTGQDDGKELLGALERGNLFVVPLDDKRQWYRYHHLFADVLRAHAKEEYPDEIPVLHRRAAAWFEAHGMPAEAIDQARAANDHDTVARLLAAWWKEFDRLGRNASVARWGASLPDAVVRSRPRLALILAAMALETEDTNEVTRRLTTWAEEAINALEDHGEFGPSCDDDGSVVGPDGLDGLRGELLSLRILHSYRSLSTEEVVATAGQALSLLPHSAHRIRTMLHMVRAQAETALHDLRSALPELEKGVGEARRDRNPMMLASVLAFRGKVYANLGRLEAGRQSYEEALVLAQDTTTESILELTSLHTGLAEILLELGDLTGSTDHATRAIEYADMAPMRSTVLFARSAAASVMLATGDIEAAFARLAEAREFVQGSRDDRFHGTLASVELNVLCRVGDLDSAADVVLRRGLTPGLVVESKNVGEAAAYARYLILRGDVGEARSILAHVLPIERSHEQVKREIRALVLEAMAHEISDERTHALESLGRATMLGEAGRFNQTFAVEGASMIGLLEALADAVRGGSGPAEAGSLAYLTYLLRETRSRPSRSSGRSTGTELREPLTDREAVILRLIVTGLRNHEIADQLFISLPTVKRHIANAYGKLGVRHRTEAIKRAHELNLL